MALSGNCGQRGRPDHSGCVYAGCSCACHGSKVALLSPIRTLFRVGLDVKRGPDRVNESDPLATNLTNQKGA